MKYQIEVQFYDPDSVPTSVGTFTREAESWSEAVEDLQDYLDDCGYPHNQTSIIKIEEEK